MIQLSSQERMILGTVWIRRTLLRGDYATISGTIVLW